MGEHEIAKAMLETVGKMGARVAPRAETETSVAKSPGLAEELAARNGE
jgi:hypothetical protein